MEYHILITKRNKIISEGQDRGQGTGRRKHLFLSSFFCSFVSWFFYKQRYEDYAYIIYNKKNKSIIKHIKNGLYY